MAEVTNNRSQHRFEGGRGVGSKLVQGALDQVRGAGVQVIAACPCVKGWIGKHPAYQDLLKTWLVIARSQRVPPAWAGPMTGSATEQSKLPGPEAWIASLRSQ